MNEFDDRKHFQSIEALKAFLEKPLSEDFVNEINKDIDIWKEFFKNGL